MGEGSGEGATWTSAQACSLCSPLASPTPSALREGPLSWSPCCNHDASTSPQTPVLKLGCHFQKSWCPTHAQGSDFSGLGEARKQGSVLRFCNIYFEKCETYRKVARIIHTLHPDPQAANNLSHSLSLFIYINIKYIYIYLYICVYM